MTKEKVARKPRVTNAEKNKQVMQNGLTEAIFGTGFGTTEQLSQVDTLFKNNRWYLVSNMRQLLSELYVEHGIVQVIVDVPVDDGLRGGVEVKSKELNESDIQKLMDVMEREGDIGRVGQALKWNRLFGGSAIVIMTNQDPSTPLEMDAIDEKSPLEFRAVDMWELFHNKQNTDDYSTAIDSLNPNIEFYDYYGIKLHRSRVLIMKGIEAPSFVRPKLRGWGFSVVESLVRSINQYLKANNLGFEVLDEFKIDIFKVKNLAQTLITPGGENQIRKRLALANSQKNYQNSIAMDAEDDYQQKQLSFSGISETMEGIRMQIASDLRMPLTKIFGISAAGFSSGEDDIENYNAMVESQVRQKAKFDILRVIEIRCQKLFGFVPEDLSITYKPLRILSGEQEENVKTQKFSRLLQAKQAGELTTKEFREGCNRGNLLEIQLDVSQDSLGKLEEIKAASVEGATAPAGKVGKQAPEAGV